MTIHSDIPTRRQIERLLEHRATVSVSIYLPTSRDPQAGRQDRVALTNAMSDALDQLSAAHADPADMDAVREAVEHLAEDDAFWSRQADSLAVFVDPNHLAAYRLPNQLTAATEVSDRFHVQPLLRAVTFPQAGYILALAKGGVRLLEIGPDGPPLEVEVPEMPRDAWDPRGNKVFKARDHNYVRQIDHSLRAAIGGSDLPLIVAAAETIAALYATVNTYPNLLADRWPGNPEELTDAELESGARAILDGHYAHQLAELADLFDERTSQERTATDVAEIARLVTMGAVDTLIVDIDAELPGSLAEDSGAVTFADAADASSYGILDELSRRTYLASGRVMAIRAADVPGGGSVAAILRYNP